LYSTNLSKLKKYNRYRTVTGQNHLKCVGKSKNVAHSVESGGTPKTRRLTGLHTVYNALEYSKSWCKTK